MQKKPKEDVGKKLRELRGIRTRTGVAREIGMAYSTLESYEMGYRFPSAKAQQRIADYYGVSKVSIFGD